MGLPSFLWQSNLEVQQARSSALHFSVQYNPSTRRYHIHFLLNATPQPTFASSEPEHLEAKFTLLSSNSLHIYHQQGLALLNLNLTKPVLSTWQEDRVFNGSDMTSNSVHKGHNLLKSLIGSSFFPENNINGNSICTGLPPLQSKPRHIVSCIFRSFSPTNLALSRANVCACSSLRKEKARGSTVFSALLPSSSRGKRGAARERMSSCAAWESGTAAFPAARHEMSHEQHEITDHRCGDSQ